MQVTISLNNNPELIKIFKQIARGFNEPLKIKKQKYKREKWLEDFYKSDEFLQAVKETEELKAAYLRGEIKGQSFEEFKAEMEAL